MNSSPPESLFELEALEPRIMLSSEGADLVGVGSGALAHTVVMNSLGSAESTDPLDIGSAGQEELFVPLEDGEDDGEGVNEIAPGETLTGSGTFPVSR